MLKKAIALAISMLAAGTVMSATASPASAVPGDFFPCPYKPYVKQSRSDFGGYLVLETCWSTNRGAWMYRSNLRRGWLSGDQLRTGYTPYDTKGWVAESYRQAPQDVDSSGEMPNQWVLSGKSDGSDLQACLTSGLTGQLYCTWP